MLLLLLACDPVSKPSDLRSESTVNESGPARETELADDSPAESEAHSEDSPHSEDPADTGPIFDDAVAILHVTLGTYDNQNAGMAYRPLPPITAKAMGDSGVLFMGLGR